MYAKILKRIIDFVLSLVAVMILSPVFLILIALGSVMMGGNPFFIQKRPGKDGRIFSMLKLRTMDNRKDENGKLLPDEDRLCPYGKFLRSTSLDELPELFNILKGDMAIVGPRPQLVRDMVFMDDEQRKRHRVRPGLTGLAQVNGRNNITWEEKFRYDLEYINRGISFMGDVKIILKTAVNVIKRSDTVRDGTATDIDFGDWLLESGKVQQSEYDQKQSEAQELLGVK